MHAATYVTSVERTSHSRMVLACVLMVTSGFAGLAYQIIWTQQSTAWLGHESAAVLAVVAAFFGGLALGALTLGSRIERSARPTRWYAGCEIAIGLWSLALVVLMQPISGALLALIGPQPTAFWHWSLAFTGTFVLLLPATAAMGATLPAMERVLTTTSSRRIAISALYAANTAGAVIGVLAAAFYLVPALGLTHTAILCATLNFGCAAVAMRLQAPRQKSGIDSATPTIRPLDSGSETSAAHSADSRDADTSASSRRTLWLLAATGLLGIGYEVLMVRALSQIAENTVYTFALLLAVYLVGTALGAAAHARQIADANASARPATALRAGLTTTLLQLLAGACLFGSLSLIVATAIKDRVLATLGMSMTTALLAEAAIATTAFLLPTVVMGALFSHLSTEARDSGISFGRAIGVNTLGAAVAPLLFGVLLLPMTGLHLALLTIALGYLMLATRGAWLRPAQWTMIAVTIACMIWAPPLQTVQIPAGGRLVTQVEGVMANVTVLADARGVTTLHINNRQQEGSSATLLADARQALLPVLLHPAPKRALFLGVGTGLTASSATIDPALRVDAVELVPEVITASAQFQDSFARSFDPSRLHLMSADARRFVRTSADRYDVIVSDNFHPARSGSASLYTVEHFASVRERLTEGGLFCQWLPLHQLDLDTLRSIVRSFSSVYPQGLALLATYSLETPTIGLISRRDGEPFALPELRERLRAASAFGADSFGIGDDMALLGTFVAGPRALAAFSASAPLNTDDRPIVAYRAPNITYAPTSTPADRLVELLRAVQISPQELLAEPAPRSAESRELDANRAARLVSYWTARNRFIEAGRNVQATSDVRGMLAQVRQPLLEVVRLSPDFRPAYDPLLRMAAALGSVDPDAARELLTDLKRLQPARPEAAELLLQLSAAQ